MACNFPTYPTSSDTQWALLELNKDETPITNDNKAQERIVLKGSKPSFTIGRVTGHDCTLLNPCISGVHCIFSYVMSSTSFNNNNASSAHSSQQDPHFSQTPAVVVGPLTADGTLVTLPCASQLPVRKVSIMDKSTNGVLVNGQLVGRDKSVVLQQGDIIDLVQVAHPRNAKYRMQYRLTVYQPTFYPVALASETAADSNRNNQKPDQREFVQDNGPADKKQVETHCEDAPHNPLVQPAQQRQHANVSPPPQRNGDDRRPSLSPSASPSIRQPAAVPKVAHSAVVSSHADEDNSAPVNTGRSLFHSVPSAKTPAPLAVGMAGVGATPPARLPSLSQMGPNTQVIPAASYTVYGGAAGCGGSASGLTSLLAEIKQAVAAGAGDAIASSKGSNATGHMSKSLAATNPRNNNNSLLPTAPNAAPSLLSPPSTNTASKPLCSSLLPAPPVPVPNVSGFGAGEKAINGDISSSGNSSNLMAVASSSTSLSNINNPAHETDDTILKKATPMPAHGARALSATPQTDGDATASPPLGQSFKGFVYASSSASNHNNDSSDNDNAYERDQQHSNEQQPPNAANGGDGGKGPSASSSASASPSTSASAAVAKMLAFISIGDDANNVDGDGVDNNKVAVHVVDNANGPPLDAAGGATRGLPKHKSSDEKAAVPDDNDKCVDEKRKGDEATAREDAKEAKRRDEGGGREKCGHTSCDVEKPSSSTSPAKPASLPVARKVSDTTQQQSQAMTISVPPRSHKAKVDDVYVLMKNTPLGSGAFATVYKAYLRPPPATSAKAPLPAAATTTTNDHEGGEVDPDGFTKPSSRAANNRNANHNHQTHSTVSVSLSSLPSVISQSQQPPPPPPAGPFFAIKVLDKTRLMGLSLKDEDAQYFNSLISKGPKQMARAIRGGVSPRRFMFAGSGTASKVAASVGGEGDGGGDPVDEEAKKAAVEATNAEALRQLMAMDSSDDDEFDRDRSGDEENESDDDELAADGAPRNKRRRREDGVGGDTTDVIASGGSSASSPSTSQKVNTAVGKKRARSPATANRNKKSSDTRPLASQNTIIRRRRVKAGEIEARHEMFLGLLSEDMKARYERYLKEKLRWRREVMILRSVSHPNVIRTFDVFDTDTSLSLVLELAEGGNLYSLITDGGSLPELLVKVIVYQLLKGVQHLHFHGIVHRDIKLENLLVGRPFTIGSFVAGSRLVEEEEMAAKRSRAGTAGAAGRGMTNLLFSHNNGNNTNNQTATSPSRVLNTRSGGTDTNKPNDASIHEVSILPAVDLWPEVKITDFGLSRMLGEGTTTMQTMCGTPIYAAPEVTIAKLRADGAQSGYTAAVDIFSIGVVAFALLTARPPFPHPKDACGRDVKGRIMYEKPLSWQRKSAYGNITPITELGRQFVAAMLTLRPVDRITADEALGHPWFADVRQMMP